MKTIKMNLRKIAIIAIILGAGLSSYAQSFVADGLNDTVTTGSNARYMVARDPLVNTALFNSSGFNWANTGGNTFTLIGGGVVPATGGSGAHTPDGSSDSNRVAMIITGAAGSSFNVTTQEVSRPKVGSGCVGAITSQVVKVVALPVLASYGANNGSCAAPAPLEVPVKLTGYGKYDVTLNVKAFTLVGVAINPAAGVNLDLSLQDNVQTTETARADSFAIPMATLTAANNATLPASCYFVITITDLQDRISEKTNGFNWLTHSNELANSQVGVGSWKYYVYPTPTTQPIQHIQNMY